MNEMSAPTPEERQQWREDAGRWKRNKVMSRVALGGIDAAEVILALLDALDAAEQERDRHGACICNTGPGTEGPDEFCPRHGRTYDDALALMDRIVANERARAEQAEAALDRVRALADATIAAGPPAGGTNVCNLLTDLRAALDGGEG